MRTWLAAVPSPRREGTPPDRLAYQDDRRSDASLAGRLSGCQPAAQRVQVEAVAGTVRGRNFTMPVHLRRAEVERRERPQREAGQRTELRGRGSSRDELAVVGLRREVANEHDADAATVVVEVHRARARD